MAPTAVRLGLGWALLWAVSHGRPAGAEGPLSEWNRRFQAAIEKLEEGKPKEAVRGLDSVLEEYLDLAGPGEANERNFGTILVYRALAEQRLGRVEDARWDWDLATNFLPEAGRLNLTRFGQAGQDLLDYDAGVRKEALAAQKESERTAGIDESCDEVTAPEVLKKPKPRYTSGARQFRVEGKLVVRVVITAEGRVVGPRVLEKLEAPALTYRALEAVRKWRFQPARLCGRPVSVYYNLTVNFDLR